jgi:NAD(P)-dependent dehydrogenase (short-subunit alcohol dehydrogenase family)
MGRNNRRPLAIITGANGGMGRCCARLLGASRDLVLTDASPALADFVKELEGEGCTLAGTVIGDLGGNEVLHTLARHAADREGFDVLVHAAGLGPSAPWRAIMAVNCIASVKLLDRLSPHAREGSVAVLIASVAGHMLPPNARIDALLAKPLEPGFCDDLEPLLAELAGPGGTNAFGTLAYFVSKKKVVDLCVEHAAAWGAAGARIVSISPGMTYTPMGRHEAELDPLSAHMVTAAPIGRWCTPMEIALTAEFLVSPAAAFITGSDIKVDGGSMAAVQLASREAWLDKIQRNRQG